MLILNPEVLTSLTSPRQVANEEGQPTRYLESLRSTITRRGRGGLRGQSVLTVRIELDDSCLPALTLTIAPIDFHSSGIILVLDRNGVPYTGHGRVENVRSLRL
ncbi:hypothetical protein J6590_004279 [Homalodisca vitripennis]|nr:hypothetical protein J6590_004279 [Homalodisca vitripennis]